MANTTNLNLVKPAGTDHALVSDINGNMDLIDAFAGSTNEAINNLDGSKMTTDVLADALLVSKTTFFWGSGNNYTGTLPGNVNYKYSTFVVTVRDTQKSVVAISRTNAIAINTYMNSEWSGWQELAPNKNTATITTDTGGSAYITSTALNIVSAYAQGYVCLPFIYTNGATYIRVLDVQTMQPVANVSVDISYYYYIS